MLESATLSGTFYNPSGGTTTTWFEYGTTTSYGNATDQYIYANEGIINISIDIIGLSENTTYHFRIVTQTQDRTYYGFDKNFTTSMAEAAVIDSDTYDFGQAVIRLANGDLVRFYRSGSSIGIADGAKIRKRISVDDGVSWGSPTDVYSAAGYDSRNVIGIRTSGGRIVLVFSRQNNTSTQIGRIYSDDNGETWSNFSEIVPANNSMAPHGKIIELTDADTSKLIFSWYRVAPEGSETLSIGTSIDEGVNWNTQTIYTNGIDGSNILTEADIEYLGDGRIIGIARVNNAVADRLYCVKSENYGSTWTNEATNIIGDPFWSTMPALLKYSDRLILMSINRSDTTVNYRDVDASTTFNTPTTFGSALPGIIRTFTNPQTMQPGIISSIQSTGSWIGFWNEEVTATDSDLWTAQIIR